MMYVNKAIIVGFTGGNPKKIETESGTVIATFGVATSYVVKKDNAISEHTEWHNIVVWKALAERCIKYLKRGAHVYIEGRLQTREYEKGGNTFRTTEIVASDVIFLDRKPKGGDEVNEN